MKPLERLLLRQVVDVIKRRLAHTYRDDEIWDAIQKLEDLAERRPARKEVPRDHP